jgi:hypothetical protein
MHGCGVAELHRGLDIAAGQRDGAAVSCVPHPQTAGSGQVDDGPAVAVLDPVGCGETKPPVVPAGNDQIADARRIAVGQHDLPTGSAAGEAVILGALVEPADQLPGGASMTASRPRLRSASQALKTASRVVAGSPTWTRCRSR